MFSRISNIFIGSPRFYLGLSITLIALGGVFQTATADTEANKAIFLRAVDELWNQGNLAVADELYATDFVNHDPSYPNVTELESYKGWVVETHTAIPDFHIEIHDMVAEGDKVAARWTMTGTHQGEALGIPPTGKQITQTGMNIHRFAGGKIVEAWWSHDLLALLQQLGAMPPTREDYTWGVPSEVTGDPGAPETNKTIFQRMFDEVMNKGNMAAVDELFVADYVMHDPVVSPMEVKGPEGFKQWAGMMLEPYFSDSLSAVEDIIAEGDKVVVRWAWGGTHASEFQGIPATGRRIAVTGLSIHRFVDGKFVESWASYDMMGMMAQLTAPPEGYDNVFFMSLESGLNMISLPLEPITPYTARSFAAELSATTVIQLDEARQRFVGFTLDAPDDGFAIEGGKGYIVNVAEARVVTFTGDAWTNEPPVEASPSLAQSDGAWAFVVSGRLDVEQIDNLFHVTVRNTRTDAIATDVARSGYFAAAFADLTRKNVVEVGDRLEVTVRTDEFVSGSFVYTVTPENIRQAYLPITLKNVDIPRQNLLLQNYPNPFNPETWIPYQIRESAEVVIRIYNAQGQLVRILDLGQRETGFYLGRTRAAYWDGLNSAGEKVASDIYFYQIQAGNFSATRKMVIVK